MPHIIIRFMSLESQTSLKKSAKIGISWTVLIVTFAALIGIIGRLKLGLNEDIQTNELVFIQMVRMIFPGVISGVLLSAVLAASMSTADSQLLAASSSVSEDLVKEVFGVKMSSKATMWVARVTIIVISIIAVFLARDPNSSVFTIVSFAWAGFGATFAPAMLTALFWKRTTKWGVLAGMISGGAMVFIWKYLLKPMGGVWGIYELLPAFIVALAFIVVVSLLTKAPDADTVATFDKVKVECKNTK